MIGSMQAAPAVGIGNLPGRRRLGRMVMVLAAEAAVGGLGGLGGASCTAGAGVRTPRDQQAAD